MCPNPLPDGPPHPSLWGERPINRDAGVALRGLCQVDVEVRCLERPYEGAKSYNLRGDVVDLPAFHRALCEVEPAAAESITYGERQIPIEHRCVVAGVLLLRECVQLATNGIHRGSDLESAMYEAMEAYAKAVGDDETAALARAHHAEEEEAARKLWPLIAPAAARVRDLVPA